MTTKIIPTLAEVKFQKLQAQAEREAFMNEVLRAEYVKMSDVEITWGAVLTSVKNHLLGLPAAIAPLIVGKENKDEVIRIMRDYIWQYLNDAEKMEKEVLLLRNKRLTKFQQTVKENERIKLNVTRIR